jgi:hypothetical protein
MAKFLEDTKMKQNKVFVVSRGAHDYSAAERFGELVFMTGPEELTHSADLSQMVRILLPCLKEAEEGDYLLWSGLKNLCCIASMLYALKVKAPKILVFKGGPNPDYHVRELDLNNLLS